MPEWWNRFFAKIIHNEETGCWLFTSFLLNGYGRFSLGHCRDGSRRTVFAHKLIYESLFGTVPPGLQLDHLCRIRHCVNPAHLEPVTCRQNLLRGDSFSAQNARKIYCPRGHMLIGDNLLPSKLKQGKRTCKQCNNTLTRKNYHRKQLEKFNKRA